MRDALRNSRGMRDVGYKNCSGMRDVGQNLDGMRDVGQNLEGMWDARPLCPLPVQKVLLITFLSLIISCQKSLHDSFQKVLLITYMTIMKGHTPSIHVFLVYVAYMNHQDRPNSL